MSRLVVREPEKGCRRRAGGERRCRWDLWRRRGWPVAVTAICLVVMLVAVAGAVLVARVVRVEIPAFVSSARGTTWVVVGSDNRADTPAGVPQGIFGDQAVADHADIVLVIHESSDGTQILSVPRDLLVALGSGSTPDRLTTTLAESPAAFTTVLCEQFGVPTDHLVMVHMDGFVGLVDAVGGIDVTVPYPVRDAYSGLDIERAGAVHLDGSQALAYVRSRHPEELIDGDWTSVSEVTGAQDRTNAAGVVVHALASKAHAVERNPIMAYRAVWALSTNLSVDGGTSLPSLRVLASLGGTPVTDVPAASTGSPIVVVPNAGTVAAFAAAGYRAGDCSLP